MAYLRSREFNDQFNIHIAFRVGEIALHTRVRQIRDRNSAVPSALLPPYPKVHPLQFPIFPQRYPRTVAG